ncbi:MAG: hypothetical protein WAV41_03455 [Microgenomates group bacterium]
MKTVGEVLERQVSWTKKHLEIRSQGSDPLGFEEQIEVITGLGMFGLRVMGVHPCSNFEPNDDRGGELKVDEDHELTKVVAPVVRKQRALNDLTKAMTGGKHDGSAHRTRWIDMANEAYFVGESLLEKMEEKKVV